MARIGVALCFALITLVGLGSCTRCYICTSQTDTSCGDPFTSNKPLQDCADVQRFNNEYLRYLNSDLASSNIPGSPRFCHKIVLQTGTVIRTCFDGNANNMNATCMHLDASARQWPSDMSKQLRHCSVCDRDGCNAAGVPLASLSLALGAVILSYISYRQ